MGVSADVLTVGLFDDRRTLHPGDSLTFGRRADLIVDENPFMHRVVGRFTHREGVWWMQNHGSTLRVELHDVESGARTNHRSRCATTEMPDRDRRSSANRSAPSPSTMARAENGGNDKAMRRATSASLAMAGEPTIAARTTS